MLGKRFFRGHVMKKTGRILASAALAFLLFICSAVSVYALSDEILIGALENLVKDNVYYQYDTVQNVLNEVESSEEWNVHFDAASRVLTLRDLNVSQSTILQTLYTETGTTYHSIGIYISVSNPITVNLEGTSTVTLEDPRPDGNVPELVSGVYLIGGGLHTIKGSGSMEVHVTGAPEEESRPDSNAIGIDCENGMLSIEGGTIRASAKGVAVALGIGAAGLDAVKNDSLYIKGGSITAEGVALGRSGTTVGRGTGISSFGSAYVSGGTVHASGAGRFSGNGMVLSSGLQVSGGEVFLTGEKLPDADTTRIALSIQPGFTPSFSPALSLVGSEAVLEAVRPDGSNVTDSSIHTYNFENQDFQTIGPAGGTMADLAAYLHIGPAVPAPTPASSAQSGWIPSYQISFLDCSGNIISEQWVAEGQPADIPPDYRYEEEELNWVYRNLTVAPAGCRVSGYIVPDTADRG